LTGTLATLVLLGLLAMWAEADLVIAFTSSVDTKCAGAWSSLSSATDRVLLVNLKLPAVFPWGLGSSYVET
jgi:hypothetical protein